MKKYTLNNDKKETQIPSDAVIKKHKSFKDLRASYDDVTKRTNVPLYKNKKLFLLLILIGVVAWVISETATDPESEKDTDKIENTDK
jgi:hypothetical protein